MALDVETRCIITTAKITDLKVEYVTCLDDCIIDDVFSNIDCTINNIKNTAVDTITDKMTNITNMCGLHGITQILPNIENLLDIFNQSMIGLSVMATGNYFDSIDDDIDLIPLGLNCVDFLEVFVALNDLCESVLTNLNSLIDVYDTLEKLQILIIDSFGIISTVLRNDVPIYDWLVKFDSTIIDLNPTLKEVLFIINKLETTTVLETDYFAKEKIVDVLELNKQIKVIKDNFISKIAALR